jgi:hypothetical protein
MAQKISEVSEQLESAEAAYAEVLTDLGKLISGVRQHHEDEHVAPADVVFRFCHHALCRTTIELEDAWLAELP